MGALNASLDARPARPRAHRCAHEKCRAESPDVARLKAHPLDDSKGGFRRRAPQRFFAIALLGFALSGCGGSQVRMAPLGEPTFELEEGRAVQILEEAAADLQLETRRGELVDVGFDAPLDVDLDFVGMRSSVAWISSNDLARWGDAIPDAAPQNQLRILSGRGESRGMHVLLLRADSYRFFREPDALQRGGISEREIEARLRQDLRDFIEFERSRGANSGASSLQ